VLDFPVPQIRLVLYFVVSAVLPELDVVWDFHPPVHQAKHLPGCIRGPLSLFRVAIPAPAGSAVLLRRIFLLCRIIIEGRRQPGFLSKLTSFALSITT
jgi:hypothetical protein